MAGSSVSAPDAPGNCTRRESPDRTSVPPRARRRRGRGAGERSEPLGTITDNLSPAGHRPEQTWFGLRRRVLAKRDRHVAEDRQRSRDESRDERWSLRTAYRQVTESRRVRACGKPGARPDGSVVLRVTDATGTAGQTTTGADGRVAGFSGLWSCANVWVCPVCSQRIAAKRAAEIEEVLAFHVERGAHPVLVTLTMPHDRGDGLVACLAAVSRGWQAVNSGRTWQQHKALAGYLGFVRALEITESITSGWHGHIHAILVFDHEPSPDTLATITDGMFGRWSAGIVKAGFRPPSLEHGIDVQTIDRGAGGDRTFGTVREWAKYISKGIAAESALGVAKQAKGVNRTVRQLMTDALVPQVWETPGGEQVATVDVVALAKLREFEQATKGRRQLTWSTGRHDLRAGVLEEEQTDDEIVAEDLEGEDVAVIPPESWRVVEPRATELLSVTEREGPDGARRWLDALDVEWWRPTRLSETRRRGDRPGQVRFDPPVE